MMEPILEICGLRKRYDDFQLNDVSLSVPYGCIMGLVGENGAGKTTLIRSVLNLAPKDAGSVKLFGQEMADDDVSIREKIGVVFDAENIPGRFTPKSLAKVLTDIYPNWSNARFWSLLEKMNLPSNKHISKYSQGMKKKLAITVAMSHDPQLLILDEPTSVLDPIAREEVLELLLDFVQDETHSVLLSSHITGDLEKIADYISFIHNGQLVLTDTKDNLMYNYGIMRCKQTQYEGVDCSMIMAQIKRDHGWQLLVDDIATARRAYPDIVIDEPDIEEIILLIVKGEHPQ